MYPVAQLTTPDGTVLEGNGVVPDIEAALDRDMLLKGIDSQLDSAVRYIETSAEVSFSARTGPPIDVPPPPLIHLRVFL
jgi:C-terminal processing protease CtpA/Prc